MQRIKNSSLFGIISIILILTFVSLDISCAYPPEHNAGNSTLATPSVLQQMPINEQAARFQQSVFSQSALIASVYDIGEYFFGNANRGIEPLPSKYAEDAMRADLGKHLSDAGIKILNIVPVEYLKRTTSEKLKSALDEIGFKGTLPDEGVVFILYRKGDKKFLVQVARKDRVSSDNLPGYEWVVSDKYVVKYILEGPKDETPKTESVMSSARSPEEHVIINKEILGAQKEGRGEAVKGRIKGWRQGPAEQKVRMKRIIAALEDYPDRVIDLGALGRVDVYEELKKANIIFIAPRRNAPPAFLVRRSFPNRVLASVFPFLRYSLPLSACQIAHAGAKQKSVYITRPLAIQMTDEELAGVIAEELIDSAAKMKAARSGIAWTTKLSREIHKRAFRYGRRMVVKAGPFIKRKIESDIAGIRLNREPLEIKPKPLSRRPLVTIFIPTRARREYFFEVFRKAEALDINKEIVIVINGTRQARPDMLAMTRSLADRKGVVVLENAEDRGKGAAVRTGFKNATGDLVLIQDADLEYDPQNYFNLMKPILDGRADVVFGSRFMNPEFHHVSKLSHLANIVLTGFSNLLTGLKLTDMWTCHKIFKKEVIDAIGPKLTGNRFEIEPEMTALIAKNKFRVTEVPLSFLGTFRTIKEGKKVRMKDGVVSVWYMIKFNLLK